MGKDAQVMAVGGYGPDVKDILDYPAEYYEDTKPGAVVTRHFFTCNTSVQSDKLAKCFGLETWDFNSHHISSLESVNLPALQELSAYCAEWDEQEIREFIQLFETGRFFFLYMPNG